MLPDHWLRPRLARASSNRIDAITPSGGEAGSHSVFMKEEHLDKHNISHAALSSIQAGELAAIPWLTKRWRTPDDRGFPWDGAPGYMIRDRDRIYRAIVPSCVPLRPTRKSRKVATR